MFPKKTDGRDLDLCGTQPAASTTADWNISPNSVPWPVDFSSSNDVLGRKNYKYHHDDNGPGSFSCDKIKQFNWIQDVQHDQKFDCSGDGGKAKTYVSKTKCLFPV
ncbi:hypothetical protein SUNI508_03190 [Seiridium unicorne]|uniref:Uncharacterized protein n=1 Tax=Seiridium unicorne TaxID=138068 RepID=A0ABR2VDP3_9PEZI